jgi:drug/metabolite transporter (DMT)-like permease
MMFLVGLITIIPFAYKEAGGYGFINQITTISIQTHAAVLYMAFLSGALAYYLYQRAMKTIETSEAAVFHYLQPLVTAPVGVLWLHEKLTVPFIVGSVVIALGVILAEMKRKRYNS